MSRINIIAITLLGLLSFWMACTDIIVPDISNNQVVLVNPNDGQITNTQTISMVWEAIDDAEEYNLQVVTPAFDSLVQIALDTNVFTNRFTHTFPAGKYEWSVVAFNAAYSSACCEVFGFTISSDSSGNLAQQTILIEAPANNSCTKDTTLTFRWSDLEAADQYRIEIGNEDFDTFLLQDLVSDNSLLITFSTDSTYYWRVRGENALTQTFTSWTSAVFTIDRQPPSPPSLLFPGNNETIILADQSPDLEWISDADAIRDTLCIFADEQLDTLVFKMGTESFDINLDETGTNFPPGDYFWQLRSIDKAGNQSEASNTRKFRVDE